MPFVDFSTISGSKVGRPFERELKIALSPETHPDVSGFSLIVSTLAPDGGCTDTHTHAESGELMIFISGRGKAWLAGEEYDLKPGASLYAPPGILHKTLNTGTEPLMIACVFVPAVPDDYIKTSIEAAAAK